jgi:2-polyprenyl-3-methyl-5-hydroxy-6-metoxy-1,4-benzoquinol methylase
MGAFDHLMLTIGRLVASAEALGAVAARARAEADGVELDPRIGDALDGVTGALGIDVAALTAEQARIAAGYAHALLLMSADLAAHPERPPGWGNEDAAILQSLGQGSAAIAGAIKAAAPALAGLADGLARDDAAFLDVGAGVAALSIAICRTWPAVRVVGLEPWEPPLRLARANVARAGLEGRIELRAQAVEDLADREAYDAAFLALPFIAPELVPVAVARSCAALRPGGWLLAGIFTAPDEPLAQRLTALRVVRAGGHPYPTDDVERVLAGAGLAEVVTPSRTWQAPIGLVAGRRPG